MSTEPNTPSGRARIELAAVPTAPGEARSFVGRTLRSWALGELADSAELIASELVTNAVKATGTPTAKTSYTDLRDLAPVVVELVLDDGSLRIAVKDTGQGRPVLQTATDDAESGRGLLLVEALSTRWDVFLLRDGKVTWADLGLSTDHVGDTERSSRSTPC